MRSQFRVSNNRQHPVTASIMKLSLSTAVLLAVVPIAVQGTNLRAIAQQYLNALAGDAQKAEARVVIGGLLADPTDKDQTIINAAVVDAYNEAYANTGSSLISFRSRIWYWPTDIACTFALCICFRLSTVLSLDPHRQRVPT